MPFGTNEQQPSAIGGTRLVLVLLVVVSLILSIAYAREDESGLLHRMQSGFGALYTPVTSAGVDVSEAIDDAIQEGENARATDATLSELEAQIAELQAQLALYEEYVLEAERLQDMLQLVNMYDIQGTAARIIGRDSDAYSHVVTASVGTNSGVAIGDTVIGSTSIIGQVIAVTANTCDIRLLTDQDSGVSVMIQSNRKQGIVKGSLEGLLYLEDVDSTVLVQVGDILVSSGLGGSYVRGLLVGQVVKVTESVGDSSRLIVVSPIDDPSSTTEVFIVKSMTSWGLAA